jgi:hypothetical protein
MKWTNDELTRIEASDELQLRSMRSDGSLRDPVTIWVVRIGNDLYIRSVKGRNGPWFKGTQDQHKGHISSGAVEKDVQFADVHDSVNDKVDEAYRSKYRNYSASIVDHVLTPEAQKSTLQLIAA